jgi:hypothetical protein
MATDLATTLQPASGARGLPQLRLRRIAGHTSDVPWPLEHVRRRNRASTLATCDATGSRRSACVDVRPAPLYGQVAERQGALPSRRARGLPRASTSRTPQRAILALPPGTASASAA